MHPLIQNTLVAAAGIVYVFAVVGIMNYLVKKKNFPKDISRKIVHIAAGSWLVCWLFMNDAHWSKYFNILPAFIWVILLLLKGFTAKPDDEAVKTMTRTGDRKELLKGPLYFAAVMCIAGTAWYKTPYALTAMGFLGWGDGLAPLFGQWFGKHKYNFLSEKSIEGSAAFFIFGLLGAIVFNMLFYPEITWGIILVCGVAATLIEAASPKDLDNILIPFIVYFLYSFLF